jgi:hypothetical protein
MDFRNGLIEVQMVQNGRPDHKIERAVRKGHAVSVSCVEFCLESISAPCFFYGGL